MRASPEEEAYDLHIQFATKKIDEQLGKIKSNVKQF
jgi:hypothetical protein